jgi:hypothetical protein
MWTELSGARSCPHPHGRGTTPSGSTPVPLKGGAMEQSTTGHDAVDDGDRIDWHQVARWCGVAACHGSPYASFADPGRVEPRRVRVVAGSW